VTPAVFGAVRLHDAWVIVRYRRNIRRLPRYVMTSRSVLVSQQRLFIGRGFLWEQKHTHRLMQTYRPEFRPYVESTTAYRLARGVGKNGWNLRRFRYRVWRRSDPLGCAIQSRSTTAAGRWPAASVRHRTR